MREVGGSAANSPLPGNPKKIWFTAILGRTPLPLRHRMGAAAMRVRKFGEDRSVGRIL